MFFNQREKALLDLAITHSPGPIAGLPFSRFLERGEEAQEQEGCRFLGILGGLHRFGVGDDGHDLLLEDVPFFEDTDLVPVAL